MAKSARSNRQRQLRSQHRLSVAKTAAFKQRDQAQQEALQRAADAGALRQQAQVPRAPAPGCSSGPTGTDVYVPAWQGESAMEQDAEQPQAQPAGTAADETASLEAELLHKMLHPRRASAGLVAAFAAQLSACKVFLISRPLVRRKRLGKQRHLAEPNTNTSKHHRRRKQRGAVNPLLHFQR